MSAEQRSSHDKTAARTLVEDERGKRPFMRGILVHSLMSRGAEFEDAYRFASEVRDALRGRAVVRREELVAMVERLSRGKLEARVQELPQPILVRSRAGASPLSKGLLAQSLLAAAVPPDRAFHTAQQIEAALFARDSKQISRGELRRLARETLKRTCGARAAERYRVWREFERGDKPLLLLMCGAPGVGKTLLAQEVAHRLGITRVTSTDAIRQVMRMVLPKERAPTLHASSYNAHRVAADGAHGAPGEPFTIDAFRSQAEMVGEGAGAMLERAAHEGVSMIMEGVSLLPGQMDTSGWRDSAHVACLAVASFGEAAFKARFRARGAANARRAERRYLKNLDAILQIQEHILESAEQHDWPIVKNEDFDDSVLSILRHVTETIRKQARRRKP